MPHPPARIRGVIGVDAAVVLLACVDLLFAAFVALQIGYLFGGRDTMDAAGLPYSAYARRGFFELIGAASLVGALLFGVGLHGRARSLLTTALGAALVGLTLAVLASLALTAGAQQTRGDRNSNRELALNNPSTATRTIPTFGVFVPTSRP